MKIKDKLKTITSGQLLAIVWIVIALIYGCSYINETKRVEENYIYCEIIKQKENNIMQISFPDGKKQWIRKSDEKISDDKKYILLRIQRYYNRINQLKDEFLLDTAIITYKN